MRIVLVLPPYWNLAQPHLALPSLKAYLECHGFDVILIDMNLELFHDLINERALEEASHLIQDKISNLESMKILDEKDLLNYRDYAHFLLRADYVINKVEDSKRVVMGRNGDAFDNLSLFRSCWNVIIWSMALVSAAHDIQTWTPDTHRCDQRTLDQTFTSYSRPTTFLQEYARKKLREIFPHKIDLLGFSVSDKTQLESSLVFSKQLKEEQQNAHIVLGGNFISRLSDEITGSDLLFKYIDSVIVGEGEIPLLKLVQSIESGGDTTGFTNIIRSSSRVLKRDLDEVESMDNLPTPSFIGLPLNMYLSPELILPVLSSRGCYWNKCGFCDHGYVYGGRYSVRSPRKVVDDLEQLMNLHNCHNFAFVDESVSPASCRRISQEIRLRNLKLRWSLDARFEREFNTSLLREMRAAGCVLLQFGMESACDRVLKAMNKGTRKAIIKRVLSDSTSVGLRNHVFLFFGYPSETREEAIETIDFVFDNKRVIHSIGAGAFVLTRYSKLLSPCKSDLLKEVIPKGGVSLKLDYVPASGIDSEESNMILNEFVRLLKKEYADADLWLSLDSCHLMLYHRDWKNASADINASSGVTKCTLVNGFNCKSQPKISSDVYWRKYTRKACELDETIKTEQISFDEVKRLNEMAIVYLAYKGESNTLVKLNAIGCLILEQCNGEKSIYEIAESIASGFRLPYQKAEDSVLNFLKRMHLSGYVCVE